MLQLLSGVWPTFRILHSWLIQPHLCPVSSSIYSRYGLQILQVVAIINLYRFVLVLMHHDVMQCVMVVNHDEVMQCVMMMNCDEAVQCVQHV